MDQKPSNAPSPGEDKPLIEFDNKEKGETKSENPSLVKTTYIDVEAAGGGVRDSTKKSQKTS